MVGDSLDSANNESVAFPKFAIRNEPYFGPVAHPDQGHLLFKVKPVAFEGFAPAVWNWDAGAVALGRNVTVAGYGANLRDGSFFFPGQATEATLRVAGFSQTSFVLDGSGQVGPCLGENEGHARLSESQDATRVSLHFSLFCDA